MTTTTVHCPTPPTTVTRTTDPTHHTDTQDPHLVVQDHLVHRVVALHRLLREWEAPRMHTDRPCLLAGDQACALLHHHGT